VSGRFLRLGIPIDPAAFDDVARVYRAACAFDLPDHVRAAHERWRQDPDGFLDAIARPGGDLDLFTSFDAAFHPPAFEALHGRALELIASTEAEEYRAGMPSCGLDRQSPLGPLWCGLGPGLSSKLPGIRGCMLVHHDETSKTFVEVRRILDIDWGSFATRAERALVRGSNWRGDLASVLSVLPYALAQASRWYMGLLAVCTPDSPSGVAIELP
jgi:hypothetical protein